MRGVTLTFYLDLILIAIATFRLAWFFTRESGPWGVAASIRKTTTLGGLLDCWKCATFWTAALCLILWYTPALQPIGAALVIVFAVSGAAILVTHWTGANHD